jgi:hypothetical protein
MTPPDNQVPKVAGIDFVIEFNVKGAGTDPAAGGRKAAHR